MRKEFEIFDEFIRTKGLRHTQQRKNILDVFLSSERHISVDELYKLIKKQARGIGYTTVYRTMKLLSECGLCGEINFGDGVLRFEHKYGHEHHDHLICIKCGKFFEAVDAQIEKLQERLARKHQFLPAKHKMEIFGYCSRCKEKGGNAMRKSDITD